jgi:hypothetical protein
MIETLLTKSAEHPIKTLTIAAFVGGSALGIQYGLWNALMGGVFGVVLTLVFVYGKPEYKYAYWR